MAELHDAEDQNIDISSQVEVVPNRMSGPQVRIKALFLHLYDFKPKRKQRIEHGINQVEAHERVEFSLNFFIVEILLRLMVLEHGVVRENDEESPVEYVEKDHFHEKFLPYNV